LTTTASPRLIFCVTFFDNIDSCTIYNKKIYDGQNILIMVDHREGARDTDIREISFINSKVYEFPLDVTKKFINLETLSMPNVSLQEILPGTFQNTSILQNLDLSGNSIEKLDSDIFSGTKKLKILNLSNNKLKEIPETLFQGLSKLKLLKLGGNKIEVLSENIFSDLKSLVEIELDHNEITFLPSQLFKNSKALKMINLDNNKLNAFSTRTFRHLNLEKLSMAGLVCQDGEDFVFSSDIRKFQSTKNKHDLPLDAFRKDTQLCLLNFIDIQNEELDDKFSEISKIFDNQGDMISEIESQLKQHGSV
jgi:hypothetical protein